MSLFSAVELAPRDPILGLNEAFNAYFNQVLIINNMIKFIFFIKENIIFIIFNRLN